MQEERMKEGSHPLLAGSKEVSSAGTSEMRGQSCLLSIETIISSLFRTPWQDRSRRLLHQTVKSGQLPSEKGIAQAKGIIRQRRLHWRPRKMCYVGPMKKELLPEMHRLARTVACVTFPTRNYWSLATRLWSMEKDFIPTAGEKSCCDLQCGPRSGPFEKPFPNTNIMQI